MVLVVCVAAVGLAFVLFCRARVAAYYGAVSAIVLGVLIPSHTPPRDVILAAVASALVLMVLGVLRSSSWIKLPRTNLWLILFVCLVTLRALVETPWPYGLVILASGLAMLLMAVIASQEWISESGRQRDLLVSTIPVLIVVEFFLTLSEEFGASAALWPQSNGTDVIAHRLNTVAPWLVGRAMGSSGHPIPLGVLAAIGLAVGCWLVIEKGKYRYAVIVILASAVLLFAGTRSAIIASIVAFAYLVLSRSKLSAVPLHIIVATLLTVGFFNSGLLSLLGLNDVEATQSYSHRLGVLQYVPEFFKRGVVEFFFGSGYLTIASYLTRSSVGADGILVFDQELLRTTWGSGFLALLLLAMAVISGWRRTDKLGRMTLVIMVIMFASWDALSWNMSFLIFIVAASRLSLGGAEGEQPSAPEFAAAQTSRTRSAPISTAD